MSEVKFAEVTSVPTPNTGTVVLYAKAVGPNAFIFSKDDTGAESQLGGGGGGGNLESTYLVGPDAVVDQTPGVGGIIFQSGTRVAAGDPVLAAKSSVTGIAALTADHSSVTGGIAFASTPTGTNNLAALLDISSSSGGTALSVVFNEAAEGFFSTRTDDGVKPHITLQSFRDTAATDEVLEIGPEFIRPHLNQNRLVQFEIGIVNNDISNTGVGGTGLFIFTANGGDNAAGQGGGSGDVLFTTGDGGAGVGGGGGTSGNIEIRTGAGGVPDVGFNGNAGFIRIQPGSADSTNSGGAVFIQGGDNNTGAGGNSAIAPGRGAGDPPGLAGENARGKLYLGAAADISQFAPKIDLGQRFVRGRLAAFSTVPADLTNPQDYLVIDVNNDLPPFVSMSLRVVMNYHFDDGGTIPTPFNGAGSFVGEWVIYNNNSSNYFAVQLPSVQGVVHENPPPVPFNAQVTLDLDFAGETITVQVAGDPAVSNSIRWHGYAEILRIQPLV